MIKRLLVNSILLSSATLAVHAYALEITGTQAAKALTQVTTPGFIANQEMSVYLMKIKLSKDEIAALKKQQPYSKKLMPTNKPLPAKVELNISKFPVLDQGAHGSCVTFATATALNYVLDKSENERVSALCSLSLGKTLSENGYYPSGWNGSMGPIVIDQFMRFGYITMESQTKNGCAGKYEYPLKNENDEGNAMNLNTYKLQSKSLVWETISFYQGYQVYWSPILTVEQRFDIEKNHEEYNGEAVLTEVKKILANNKKNNKHIVTIGLMLYDYLCHVGACAKHNSQDDTWALTSNIDNMRQTSLGPNAGHEVTIIGYDDNAIAIDNEGKTHQGLLTIRNSWGVKAGDKGNYYMTYDYFKVFVDEVQKVSKIIVTRDD